jgi:dihydrofolate reductase
MSRIVVSQFVSLDGVIEDPVGTSMFDSGPEGQRFKVDEMMESDAMLMACRTYEGYAAAWPSRGGDYADKLNGMPKYLVSATIEDPGWSNTTVIDGDVPAQVQRLKEQRSGDILVHGSAQLVHTLMEHDLVDEWRLMVFPIVVGASKRCFGDPDQAVSVRSSNLGLSATASRS